MNQIHVAQSGQTYTYELERQTRTAYREFMNPETRYDRVYFQVNVFNSEGARVNFAFVDDENDVDAIRAEIEQIDQWVRTPDHVLESMHSRFD